METQRNILIVVLVALSFVLYQRWQVFQQGFVLDDQFLAQNVVINEQPTIEDIPEVSEIVDQNEDQIPSLARLDGPDTPVETTLVTGSIVNMK